MMNFKHIFLATSVCMTLNLAASNSNSRQNSKERQSGRTSPSSCAAATQQQAGTISSSAATSATAAIKPQPFSEFRYNTLTFATAKHADYLIARENDGSFEPTHQINSTLTQTIHARAIKERMEKPNLLSTNKKGEWNPDKLARIIAIGKKYSALREAALQTTTSTTTTFPYALELEASQASRYRALTALAMNQYLLNEKIRIFNERRDAKQLADDNFKNAIIALRPKAETIIANYNYFKERSSYAAPMVLKGQTIDDPSHYQTDASLTNMFDNFTA